jgi:hypothetical protein
VALVAVTAGSLPAPGATPAAADCGARDARGAFTAFVGAFNRGDVAGLDALFASWPAFRWYSSNEPGRRTGNAAFTRSTLMAYFRERHAARDRLRLVTFRFNGSSASHGNFQFALRRSAVDYRRGTWFRLVGKGAISCRAQPGRFIVLSLGGPAPAR